MDSLYDSNDEVDWKIHYNKSPEGIEKSDNGSLAQDSCLPKSMWILSDTKTELSTVTELTSSKLKLPCLSNQASERVFPIRSIVSFDSAPSSALQTPSLEKQEAPSSPFTEACRSNELSDVKCTRAPLQLSKEDEPYFEQTPRRPSHLLRLHQETSYSRLSASPLIELNKRIGSNLLSKKLENVQSPSEKLQETIYDCSQILQPPQDQFKGDREFSVHQSGALLVARISGSNIKTEVASDNTGMVIGYSPKKLFEMQSLCCIIPGHQRPKFRSHIETVLADEYDTKSMGPEVFILSVIDDKHGTKDVWCSMHSQKPRGVFILCELEPLPTIQTNKEKPHSHPTHTSVQSLDRQNNVLAGIEDRYVKDPHEVESEFLNRVPRIAKSISMSWSLEDLVNETTSALHSMTGLDRVTIYHFDSERNGIVVADSVDHSSARESYEGLHFQEDVFPDDVKKPYTRNKVTLAYRGEKTGASLVYKHAYLKDQIDLSHCYLLQPPKASKKQSDVHACLSIGLQVFGKLWGLIVCQSYTADLYVYPIAHRLCWFISEIVSSNIERLSYTLPFRFKQESADALHKGREIQTPSGDLLSIFGADYAVTSVLDESKIMGKPPESQEILALLEYFRAKKLETIIWSTEIMSDLEDLDYGPGFHSLSSLLYIPLLHDGHDFVVFFRGRKETNEEKPHRDSNSHLDWSAADFGKASMLSLLYRTFTGVWQENEATIQNNQLMRLLLANSAHEFRTPLNAIINYLEIALDGNLNQETRENLSRSHSASKSLIFIINDLLDLTNAENGKILIKDEKFSLSDTLSESIDIFWEEARQKDVDIQVVQHSTLPAVLGDQRRVRQVITNLISNAVQHTSQGAVTIESCVLTECWEPGHIAVEVAIHDTGSGMSQESAEALFCELEQVSNKEYMQKARNHGSDVSGSETENVLGLGLALVARIVRNMDGQLSLKSEEGKGSCFKIRLKFPIPQDEDASKEYSGHCSPNSSSSKQRTYGDSGSRAQSKEPTSDMPDVGDKCGLEDNFNNSEDSSAGIPCRCGDEIFPASKHVDVDITLENGKNRYLVLSDQGPDEISSQQKFEDENVFDHKTTENNSSILQLQHQKAVENDLDATSELKQQSEPASKQDQVQETPGTDKSALRKESVKSEKIEEDTSMQKTQLQVLVAEDDPINSTIVKKRLEKFGYSVRMSANGKECVSLYSEDPSSFDVILMDLQMPIVDGISATKMIRETEDLATKEGHGIQHHNRIPVFAVSATLFEKDRQIYLDAGFDGWIMKPIDFQRVHCLLDGVMSTEERDKCLYKPGIWEEGGWFEKLA